MSGYDPADLIWPELANSFPDPEFSVIRSGDGSMKQSPWQFYSPMVEEPDECCYNQNEKYISQDADEVTELY